MLRLRSTERAVGHSVAALLLLTATCAGAAEVWLRETHFIMYEVEAGEEVAFTMTPQARGTASPQPIEWRIYDAEGAIIAEAAPQFGTVTVRYMPRRSGLNVAWLIRGRTPASLIARLQLPLRSATHRAGVCGRSNSPRQRECPSTTLSSGSRLTAKSHRSLRTILKRWSIFCR
jgi:hypothetical protein